MEDIFKVLFEAPVEIPDRPENIERPAAYSGPTFDLGKFVGSSAVSWKAKASENSGNASLVT